MDTERNTQRMIELTVLLLCGLTVALVALVAVLAQHTISTESWIALGVLAVFALAATNFDVTARAGLGISGNVMVLAATLVVFREYDLFLGAVIVACCGALDFTQLRDRAWEKVAFNAAADSLSMLAATIVFWAMTGSPTSASTSGLLLATALGAATYLGVHAPLISLPVALSCGEPYVHVLREIVAFDVGAFP